LVIFLLIIIFLNVNIQEKFINNKYLKDYESFKNFIIDYSKEKFSNKEKDANDANDATDESYDIKPYIDNKEEHNKEPDKELDKEENNKIEPFKTEVLKLKDLYENIKLEITKLK
jgi:hypothetical protein